MSDPNSTDKPKAQPALAASAGSASGRPRDQQWMQEMCELVKNKMPENYSFVVFGFPTCGSDRCYYASNAARESIVEALKQWIEHTEKHWLKHVPETPNDLAHRPTTQTHP